MSEVVPLGSVTTWLSGGTPNRRVPEYWSGTIPWISATTLKQFEACDSDQRVTRAAVHAGSTMAPLGSTLLLVRGSALHSEIRASLVTKPVCFNQDVKALVPDSSLLPRFLTHSIRANADNLLRLVTSAGNTAGVLDTNVTKRLPIWVPDIGEQQNIIKKLDDVEEIVSILLRLIHKKRNIKLGLMQQYLTGQIRIPGFSEPWRTCTVGMIADVKTGPFGSALHERDYVRSGTPIITVEHLTERGINGTNAPMVSDPDFQRLRSYTLREGDIVFSRVGSINRSSRVSLNETGWLFSGRLLRVRFDARLADSHFMSAQFHSRKFIEAVKTVAVGQTMPSLNTAILKGIHIALPDLQEQKAIGAIASDLDHELGILEARLHKARAVRQGIMQQLLTDRTRLSVLEGVA